MVAFVLDWELFLLGLIVGAMVVTLFGPSRQVVRLRPLKCPTCRVEYVCVNCRDNEVRSGKAKAKNR